MISSSRCPPPRSMHQYYRKIENDKIEVANKKFAERIQLK